MDTRRVSIHVHPDGSVHVDAPSDSDVAEVMVAVRRSARWIWQRLCAYRNRTRHIFPREYLSGETHLYLGKRYVLKVIQNPAAAQSVKLLRGRLEVRTHSRDADKVRALLDSWYRERAEAVSHAA